VIFGETKYFPLQINNHSFHGLDRIICDYILRPSFMQLVSPFTLDPKEREMKMYINDHTIYTYFYMEGLCKTKDADRNKSIQPLILTLELNKMERIACFSLSHQEVLNPIKEILLKYYTFDYSNAL